jgi:hypothetical protein
MLNNEQVTQDSEVNDLKMKTVAVYKTNVDEYSEAETILDIIREQLPDTDSNFDLEDCDNVLRVESLNGKVDEVQIQKIVEDFGFLIEELI